MPVTIGTRLGPYEVLGPIGSGGMGEVYKRKRLEREAAAVSSLNHSNICVLHDIGQQDGTDFLVMEYLEGETLAMRLSRGPLPMEQGIALAIQMSHALEAAHRKWLHRDLKPANIMLTKSGCRLLDFGLARMDTSIAMDGETRTAAITNPGTVLGTFQYMAPEQLKGKEADARTDIFAFGAVTRPQAGLPMGTSSIRHSRRQSACVRIVTADASNPARVLVKEANVMRRGLVVGCALGLYGSLLRVPPFESVLGSRQPGGSICLRGRSPILARRQMDGIRR